MKILDRQVKKKQNTDLSKDARILELINRVNNLEKNLQELRHELMIPEKRKRPKIMW